MKKIEIDTNLVIQVAEKLYYLINSTTTMDIPSIFYEKIEKLFIDWKNTKEEIPFYNYCYNLLFVPTYKIGDIVFTIVNGSIIKTRIIKLYDNHVGVYSGEWMPYERSYNEIARNIKNLYKQIDIEDLTEKAMEFIK